MDTKNLREASKAVFLATNPAVAYDLADKLSWAADEIDRLRLALSECTETVKYDHNVVNKY